MDQMDGARQPELNLLNIETLADLGKALRALRRRHGRKMGKVLTFRELEEKLGYPKSSIGAYFNDRTLPPVERLDELVTYLAASPDERRAFATARDHVEERDRRSATPATEPPRQLPKANRKFVGRERELRALTNLQKQAGADGTVVISAMEGSPGIGKTALALFWSHQIADQFPDGHLYVDLRGFGQTGQRVRPEDALHDFLTALHVPPERIPADLDQRAAAYRSMLAHKRILVVLDNAYDADVVRPLLPGSPTCMAIVTSRNTLTALVAEGASSLRLDLLPTDEARELLIRYIGCERLEREPSAIDDLITRCAGLPLALTIVAARADMRPTSMMRDLCDELAERGLDALATGDPATTVETVFSWSYAHLNPPTQRMFRLLGIHSGPNISLPAAASLASIMTEDACTALNALAQAHLIEEPVRNRFTFHDLLREYASKLAYQADTEGDLREARHRVLDHYLHTGHVAARLLNEARPKLALNTVCSGTIHEDLTTSGQALAWFKTECAVLLASAAQAAYHRFDSHAWMIPWTLADFLDRQGRWEDMVASHRIALAAVQRLGDQDGEARTRGGLGRAYRRLGSYENALTHFRELRRLFEMLGNADGQARAHRSIAQIFEDQGHYREALQHAEHALTLANNPVGQAGALNQVGWYHALLGDYQKALDYSGTSLDRYKEVDGEPHGEAAAWDTHGFASYHNGDYQAAISSYSRAVDLFEAAGDSYKMAETLDRLAETRVSTGNTKIAHDTWKRASEILKELNHPKAEEIHNKLCELTQD
jgi:tetratricopeptide (TPR) repeat protein/transcriptional regulator with XRE-family HTH domain